MYFKIPFKDEKNEAWRSCTMWWFYQHPFPFFWQTVPLPQSTHSPCGLGRAPCTTADPRQIITPPEQLLPGQVRDISGFKGSDSWVFNGTSGMRVSVSPSGLEGWEGNTRQQADPKMEKKHPFERSEGWIQLCPMPRHLGMIIHISCISLLEAAVNKLHKLGGPKQHKLISDSPGGQKTKIKP